MCGRTAKKVRKMGRRYAEDIVIEYIDNLMRSNLKHRAKVAFTILKGWKGEKHGRRSK